MFFKQCMIKGGLTMNNYVLRREEDCTIYNKETGMHLFYLDEEELDIAEEFVEYLNGLDKEIKDLEQTIFNYKYYHLLDKQDLIVQNKRFRATINYERGVHELELNYCKEVLDGLIKDYPKSKGLLEFKSIMDW